MFRPVLFAFKNKKGSLSWALLSKVGGECQVPLLMIQLSSQSQIMNLHRAMEILSACLAEYEKPASSHIFPPALRKRISLNIFKSLYSLGIYLIQMADIYSTFLNLAIFL